MFVALSLNNRPGQLTLFTFAAFFVFIVAKTKKKRKVNNRPSSQFTAAAAATSTITNRISHHAVYAEREGAGGAEGAGGGVIQVDGNDNKSHAKTKLFSCSN